MALAGWDVKVSADDCMAMGEQCAKGCGTCQSCPSRSKDSKWLAL